MLLLALATLSCSGRTLDLEKTEESELATPLCGDGDEILDADETALPLDSPRILGWASSVEDVEFGERVEDGWRDVSQALGPAEGRSDAVVSLGEGGSITLAFDPPLVDGKGHDFAVFENGFSEEFLELALVEVSSGGVFVRFAARSTTPEPVGDYGAVDAAELGGLAGQYRLGLGTPFDLAALRERPEVRDGRLELSSIEAVRLVDVVGDGEQKDCAGHPIYDPYPTRDSAGFDLDGVAALHVAE